ncbi:unnamed protein product [Linum tenue]|uniref:Uncharacterized protein n=1 Tax=Linum tenue TaxID=586396 RepID=A0AAV0M494_9ROSI|nr:unnamed protein product [Linum tenue]
MSVTASQQSIQLLQLATMDRHITPKIEIPAGSFSIFLVLTLLIWVPLYDRAILPLASTLRGWPVSLPLKTRLGLAILLSSASMAALGLVESIRRARALDEGLSNDPNGIVNMSAMWFLLYYVPFGVAEAFNYIGQNEFYYSELPRSMASISTTLYQMGLSVSNLVASLVLSVVDRATRDGGGGGSWVGSNINKGHYDYYYWVLAGLSLGNFVFLNKACIIQHPEQDLTQEGKPAHPWRLCTVEQVEDLKSVIRIIPIWSAGMLMSVTASQQSIQLLQLATMDRHITPKIEIPAGSFSIFLVLTLLIWVPLYDRAILPLASTLRGWPVSLPLKTRLGLAILLSSASMAALGLVESIRRARALDEGLSNDPNGIVNMSAMWFLLYYVPFGVAEAFNYIGQNEFYYSELPRSMASISTTLYQMGLSVSNLVASLVLSVVDRATRDGGGGGSWVGSNINKGHYDYYYWVLAGLSLGNFVFLNKACIIQHPEQDLTQEGKPAHPWRLCTVEQVEDLKSVIRIIPIWSAGMLMSVTASQQSIQLLQLATMDRHITPKIEIPAGSFSIFLVLTLLIWVPLYDRAILPLASTLRGWPVSLPLKTRLGLAILLSSASMAALGLVESIRRARALDEGLSNDPNGIVNMSAMWFLLYYVPFGVAEAFNYIGQNEFYYSELPRSMASISTTLYQMGLSVSNLVASLVLSVVDRATRDGGGGGSWVGSNINKGHYDYYYWVLAGIRISNRPKS